ncbi:MULTISPECIES: GapA-binding peptide SR1P [Paenibacillus]|uniref:GapA-binding peptide SR1P n=1 Tax=Paenibacillus campinasensis TaxID=66347 RepID=A0A268EPA9_9BACL|nr:MULTISPECIES: GapA-binding peptide SR1P [Paenibacillus]MUG66124.1 GapA-binding peptide SR1P [Paenibacillus campinasensis]PAD74957.1 GapA-binding peptide SR1P [Paenibacillus campinasensis]PAK50022.1 GapA-binding peptide SR1P [Paenibacillus sp. 7541]
MRALTSPEAAKNGSGQDWGLIICTGCSDIIDTMPTDGVKILYGYCGNEECTGKRRED